MKKRYVIALAFSDIHLHEFKAFDLNGSRLNSSMRVLWQMASESISYKVPVLFAGDLFHNPKELSNQVIQQFMEFLKTRDDSNSKPIFAISGNHDLSQKNTLDNRSPSYIASFNGFGGLECIDYRSTQFQIGKDKYSVSGVPYMNNGKEWIKAIKTITKDVMEHGIAGEKKILLLHGDAPGAVNPSGHEIGDTDIPTNIDKFFKAWDLVLFGHIHKPQKLGKNSYMLGSPIHQNSGDTGCEMGYWKVFNDMSMEFVPLNEYPKFVYDNPREKDYLIQGSNEEEEDIEIEEQQFDIKKSRKSLAKEYLKLKGIDDKEKLRLLTDILNQA